MNPDEICHCNGTRYSDETTIVTEVGNRENLHACILILAILPCCIFLTQWDLICDKSWVVDTITTFQMCGMFIGNSIPPQLSDWCTMDF